MKFRNLMQLWTVSCWGVMAMAFIAGCGGQPPQQDVDAAKAALQAAITAGAEQYAPSELKAAQELMARLNDEMGRKDYKAAKQTAIQSREAAERAKGAIADGKTKAREAATATVTEAKQALEKVKGLLAENEKFSADLPQPLKDQLPAAEVGVGELDGMIATDEFKKASDQATQLKELFAQIEQELTAAKTKAEEAKKANGASKSQKK